MKAIREIPVIAIHHLQSIGTLRYGISTHCGIIVVWDEDHDVRVLSMIEERFPIGTLKPLAVCEHEGNISMLWKDEDSAVCGLPEYTVEDDLWVAYHYFLAGNNVNEATVFNT